MSFLGRTARAWRSEMTAADRARIVFAWCFVFGAVSHIAWLLLNGSLWYYGPAPSWAPWFWYALCLIDLVVFWLMHAQPRAGIALGVVTMIVSLWVNWTQFPTFEFVFNWVLLGLTAFGVVYWICTPWLWLRAKWRLSSPPSSAHSAG